MTNKNLSQKVMQLEKLLKPGAFNLFFHERTRFKRTAISLLLISFIVPVLTGARPAETVEMTIHDFMHDYTKPLMKRYKRTGKGKEKILKILEAVPDMALAEQKDDWQKIVNEAIESDDLEKSCSGCHKPYKKKYKKTYRKRPVQIPAELIRFLKK